jgi:hypothetical protein
MQYMKMPVIESGRKVVAKSLLACGLLVGTQYWAPPVEAAGCCPGVDDLNCSLACLELGITWWCVGCNSSYFICEQGLSQPPCMS